MSELHEKRRQADLAIQKDPNLTPEKKDILRFILGMGIRSIVCLREEDKDIGIEKRVSGARIGTSLEKGQPWVEDLTDHKDILAFIEKKQKGENGQNIHWQINVAPKKGGVTCKNDDISEGRFVYCEIDDLEKAPESYCESFKGFPAPHVVGASGGGTHLLWRIKPTKNLDLVEGFNKALTKLYKADETAFNRGRLFRVFGTWNFLNRKKRVAGRQQTMSRLVKGDFYRDPVSLSDLVVGFVATRDAFAARLAKEGVDADPKLNGDRSDAVFHFVQRAQKALGHFFKTEQIAVLLEKVLEDPDMPVADHITKGGGDAARQVERCMSKEKTEKYTPQPKARKRKDEITEKEEDEILAYFQRFFRHTRAGKRGSQYIYIGEPGLSLVRSQQDILAFRPDWIVGDDVNAGTVYMRSSKRISLRRDIYAPDKPPGDIPDPYDVDPDAVAYNLWAGFGYEPEKGDLPAVLEDHIFRFICDSNKRNYEWFMNFCAATVQWRADPLGCCPVLFGPPGAGKSLVANALGGLFRDQNWMSTSDSKKISGSFNSHTGRLQFIAAEETTYSGDKKGHSALKDLITTKRTAQEAKGKDVDPSASRHANIMFLSNHSQPVRTDTDDRRFKFFECKKPTTKDGTRDTEHFRRLFKALNDPKFRAQWLGRLMDRDISKWDPQKDLFDEAKKDSIVISLDETEQFWDDVLDFGRFHRNIVRTTAKGDPIDEPDRIKNVDWPEGALMSRAPLWVLYVDYKLSLGAVRISPKMFTAFRIAFKSFGAINRHEKLLSLDECRENWHVKLYGKPRTDEEKARQKEADEQRSKVSDGSGNDEVF